jgi:hypothetical protein
MGKERWRGGGLLTAATTGYQHMAMMSSLPASAYPLQWISIWQASDRYEGSHDMHFECAVSKDGDTWSRDCNIPLNRGPDAKWLVRALPNSDCFDVNRTKSDSGWEMRSRGRPIPLTRLKPVPRGLHAHRASLAVSCLVQLAILCRPRAEPISSDPHQQNHCGGGGWCAPYRL